MPNANEYHAGEIAVQQRAGERSIAARRGGMIGDRLVDGARAFLSRQGVAAVGAEAPDGTVWASLWNDAAGFLRAADDGEHVEVIPALDRTVDVDPVRPIVQAGAPLGMLVIDLATRQRLRINGIVTRADALGMELRVRETFGNCNKYIQRRQRSDAPTSEVAPVTHGHALDAERRDFIARTDTAFVASIHPVRGLDVSHRGGQPGFIWVESDGTLRMPDYPGNSMFQTFGNFEVDPRAGLALIDAILTRGDLKDYRLAHAARAELCRRLGRTTEARASFERALKLTRQDAERRFLERRLAELATRGTV